MQFSHKNQILQITGYLIFESEQILQLLNKQSTDEPLFRFNFFMLVRLHEALLGIEILLTRDDHRPLLYSFINILRPILIDMAYSGTLHKIFNNKTLTVESILKAAKYINELLISEANKVKSYAKKTSHRMGVDWTVEVENYKTNLNQTFLKYYSNIDSVTNEYPLQIEKIFENAEKDLPHLLEVWDTYKVYSQMTHINDFYGEQQKKPLDIKSTSIYLGLMHCIDHFVIIIRTMSCLPNHQNLLIDKYNKILVSVETLKSKL
ncbi:MAG: hypothetical protein IBJ16_08025 [Chitinophagaceae bacterium]|nr:hypothetical protein [Chitinophagaceae bacterium]